MARKIEVQIVGDSKQLEAALARSGAKTQAFGDKLKSTGKTMTTHLTLPLVALGAVAVKTTADFESSLEKIQGLVGASSKQMETYRKSILALAPAVAKGPKELADALYFVTSSGFKGAQALDILKQSAKASTAGLGDTQQIADLVTSAMTAYGSKTLDAAKATDILVAATKAGKGDPQEFAQALQLNVAAAQTLGITFDQLAAATAALSTVNSNVSEDATQLSGIMQALIKPSAEATKQLHAMGLSADDLRQSVRQKGLLQTLLDLKKATHGNIDELGKLFPNVRGLRGFLTLAGQAAQRNVSIFDQVAHSTGDMSKAFQAALTNDPTKQWEKLKAQLQVLAIVIGSTLLPMLTSLAGFLATLAAKFNGLSSRQQHAIVIAAALVAALGPVIAVVGNLIVVVRALSVAMLFLAANPVGLVIAGVIALGVALVVAYKKSQTFRNIVNGVFHAVEGAVKILVGIWKSEFDIIVGVMQTLWSWVHKVLDAVESLIGAIKSIPNIPGNVLGAVTGGGGPNNYRSPTNTKGGSNVATRGVAQVNLHLDGKVFYSAMVNVDKDVRRQNGRSLLAT